MVNGELIIKNLPFTIFFMSYPAQYFLRTPRLGFRCWTSEDFDLAWGLWGDHQVTRLIDARGALSPQQVQEKLEYEIAQEKQIGLQYWPIFLIDSGDHVGCCGLRPYDPQRHILEIGFHIRSALWGKGYATEAAQAIIAYAFDHLGVKALFAGHNPQNTASADLLKKLDFGYTHDEYYQPTGLQHPSYLLTAVQYEKPSVP